MPEGESTRIEIWFKPADVVSLPVYVDAPMIDRASPELLARIAAQGIPVPESSTVYSVVGTAQGVYYPSEGYPCEGWVIAGGVSGHEDDEPFGAPRRVSIRSQ